MNVAQRLIPDLHRELQTSPNICVHARRPRSSLGHTSHTPLGLEMLLLAPTTRRLVSRHTSYCHRISAGSSDRACWGDLGEQSLCMASKRLLNGCLVQSSRKRDGIPLNVPRSSARSVPKNSGQNTWVGNCGGAGWTMRDLQIIRVADSGEPFFNQSASATGEAGFWDRFVECEMQPVIDRVSMSRGWLLINQCRGLVKRAFVRPRSISVWQPTTPAFENFAECNWCRTEPVPRILSHCHTCIEI